jgi:hypothetical protein
MTDERIKIWQHLDYKDPSQLLRALRPLQLRLAQSALSKRIKSLRGPGAKVHRERWHAALFTHGLSVCLNLPSLEFASVEKQDYDCVARHVNGDTCDYDYVPIQLKELVPAKLNPGASLEREIAKLTKYSSSTDLCVAVFLNRAGRLDLASIKVPKLHIAELWLYGNLTPDQSKWFLYGNVLAEPRNYEFAFPSYLQGSHLCRSALCGNQTASRSRVWPPLERSETHYHPN